ncbi:TetR/AcrR family transcriptional regulator [Cohnella cellulosilytica]|uniref:TetR/AcrR family transcriptional regulator n=1 Tax=Cohnella cellulosilytica TaxID=986710 RepID=A0ABW2F663_9BACL
MADRRERRDAVENRQLILQTAHELFSEYGVQPVSMHQIAKSAGIGQATLYRKYAHKGDLCLDMLHEYGNKLIDEIGDYLERSEGEPARERLSVILGYWIDTIEDKAELLLETEAKTNCVDDRGNFFHSPMYRYSRSKISELLTEIASGETEPPFDPDLAAHAMICSLSPIGYFQIKKERGYSREQLKEHYLRLCLRAVEAPAPGRH